jgi:hypothetical protein
MINNIHANKYLLILLFNANGLKNHLIEIQSVPQNNIALITETHLTQYSNVYIPGNKLLKANHSNNKAHGGVAILIKSTLLFQILPNFCQNFLQSCTILINKNIIPVTIAALYSSPKHNVTFAGFNNCFCTFGKNFIVGGDFNAKHQSWGCRTNNPRGFVLRDIACKKKLKILAPPGPTYWPTSAQKNPDILDIFVSKIPSNLFHSTDNILDLNSNYSSVVLTLNEYPLTRLKPPKLFNTTTDRYKIHDLVNQKIKLNIKLKSTNDIDSAVNSFTNIIQSVA